MTSRIGYHRLPSPPRLEERRRAPAVARPESPAPSPTVLVGKVVMGALLFFLVLTLAALAPMAIAVLLALAGVSGLLAAIGRERYSGRPKRRSLARRGVARTREAFELGRARYSASDRPTPREWRRRPRVEYPMHAIG